MNKISFRFFFLLKEEQRIAFKIFILKFFNKLEIQLSFHFSKKKYLAKKVLLKVIQ